MEVTDVDNDTRGWIMCIVSGIACVFGSTFICVDVIVRLFPGKRNFKLQESNVFLASSLSLSFGIMMYTALNGMLPSAKQYLKQDNHHHSQGHGYDYGAHDEHHDEHDDDDLEAQHHHHVPTNAFLALGLQTAIAISLHKFPEGFITYATNHANPALGLNVFMGLFVHNITEGFTMALPLYMAYNSRIWALVVTASFGGLSQPLGAGIAVLLLKHVGFTPNPLAYGCMFAITAGTMVSVGLQLFVEALSMNHNRNLCMLFGFTGMALVGVTNAIASTH
ncbi:Zinc-regulated transporter 3 [Colletotrichum sidae]|uniref:Zinc-regulated transporter 3 n=1 Tax=Colletotrichum sidae TaxID=1347389 RepID=A0A4R8TFD0_9PEZI|nr:Zinc-regulated transporter 3 [Colletotrichum sidae]